jgi:4-hydroxy-tetrahydrodipicolinate reductase
MLKVLVTGAAGKMGKTNIKVITENKDCTLSGAVEFKDSPYIGQDAGLLAGVGNLNIPIKSSITEYVRDCDVIIDFSAVSALQLNVEAAVKNNCALVIGTTGISDKDQALVQEAGKSIPVIWAPNFSVGVNLMAKLCRLAAEVLDKGFDVEIVEAHHKMKKDSPSGTAIQLLNVLKDAYHTNDIVYGREGLTGERPENQIGVSAVRGGDVVGDHTVYFLGIGERVEITHKASTRETFARGALRAAQYIVKKGKGLYTMKDVLGMGL